MHLHPGILNIPADHDEASLAKELQSNGWTVYVLPRGITDRRSFFEAVKAVLPLNPPVQGSRSWDALSDSMWSGLDELETTQVAILWPESKLFQQESPQEFSIAMELLSDLTQSLGDAEATVGHPKDVVVFLT